MGHYLPDEALDHMQRTNRVFSSLEQVITEFPVKLKQAMYAAAELGSVRAGTWNGCAFNKAGFQLEQNVDIQSYGEAAMAFGVRESLVERFVRIWDSKRHLTDAGRATLLKRCLTNVGVSTPPEKYQSSGSVTDATVVVFDELVYKGAQTKFIEQLDRAETLEDMVALGLDEDVLNTAHDLIHLVPA